MFVFQDRMGNLKPLTTHEGQSVAEVLLVHRIPPASVIVLRDGEPVSDSHRVEFAGRYVAYLIEGYDIGAILDIYRRMGLDEMADFPYVKQRLRFSTDGILNPEAVPMTLEQLGTHVENTIVETSDVFRLIQKDDRLLVGLSGGVDSSALLLALAASSSRLPAHQLVAVTFEDYDSHRSPTFSHAADLARTVGVQHHVVPADLVEKVFHLNTPLREILPRLVKTSVGHHVMYIDHHTTRRALEVFAEQNGLNRIALGLHTTDIVAGLLNGWVTGYKVADLPVRNLGNVTYIYPLAFVTKRELHLYHHYRTKEFAHHSTPNLWELHPKDRNFYYYLADELQAYWPGIEVMLFTAHNMRVRRQELFEYDTCENCGAKILKQAFTVVKANECDACAILRTAGFIS